MKRSVKLYLRYTKAVLLIIALVAALTLAVGCSCSAQSSSSASSAGSSSASSSSASSSASTKPAPSPGQVQVPNLMRLESADAEKLVTNVGLKLGTSKYVFDDNAHPGLVVGQEPEALSMVDAGTEVVLTISKGKESRAEVTIPDIIGLTQSDAEKALSDAKLVAVEGNPEVSDKVGPGRVCKQSIAAGTKVLEGTQVMFSTALSDDTVAVPDLSGQLESDARAALNDANLGCDSSTAYSDTVGTDHVISQDIPAGTKVAKGTLVTIKVSLGTKPADKVKVPNIMTYDLQEAIDALDSCGLKHRYTGEKDGNVIAVDPEVGTKVDVGSTVTFTLQHASSLVAVPDVAGMDGPDASAALDAVGLVLDYDETQPDRKLSGTDPVAGTMVDVESVVQAQYKGDGSVKVPDVAGKKGSDAAAAMEKVGLSLDYREEDPDAKVSGTDPAAGTKVAPGSTVTAIYENPQTVSVPDVSGMSGSSADSAMEAVGLDLDYDQDDPDKTIESTNPAAGTDVEPGTTVQAVYPAPEKISVPDVAGMNGSDAAEAMEDVGLSFDYDQSAPNRLVGKTDPAAGKQVEEGATVRAVYDEKVKVPELTGMSGSDAAEKAEELGLKLDYDKKDPDKPIIGTDPAAGKTVEAGTILEAEYNSDDFDDSDFDDATEDNDADDGNTDDNADSGSEDDNADSGDDSSDDNADDNADEEEKSNG